MDGFAFDRLTRSLSAQPTRRRLLGLLTALPLAGIVTAQDDERTTAAGRRHRSKHQPPLQGAGKHHHQGKKKGEKQGAGQCAPDPLTATCAGQCGPVVNNCGAQVDCGSCACTASLSAVSDL